MKQIQKVNKAAMRQNNSQLIFETVYENEGITRASLAKKTEMSTMAVGRIADILLNLGLLTEHTPERAAKQNDIGRPATTLYINRREQSVGVSLDSMGVFLSLVDPYGALIKHRSHRFRVSEMEPAHALDVAGHVIETFVKENGVDESRAVGLVIPGLIDCEERVVRYSSQLRWNNVPVSELLEPFVKSVVIDNDIKARAQAENRFGAAKGHACSVLLNIGSGVGAGIVINNEIFRGAHNLAGEIGHTALSLNNRMCACGRKGCLEANIAYRAVMREARTVMPNADMLTLVHAYLNDERWAATLIRMTAEHLLMVIDLLANTYAPDAVVLCGSLIDECPPLRDLTEYIYNERRPLMLNRNCALSFSKFGPDGNVIAAANLAFTHNVKRVIGGTE